MSKDSRSEVERNHLRHWIASMAALVILGMVWLLPAVIGPATSDASWPSEVKPNGYVNPTPVPTSMPVSSKSALQSNQGIVIAATGAAFAVLVVGFGYWRWKLASTPSGTAIPVHRGPLSPATDADGSRSSSPPIGRAITPDLGQTGAQLASLADVRRFLVDRFDIEELKTLCFDLGVDYDTLHGEGKDGKARELVARMKRDQRLPELMKAIQQILEHEKPAEDSST